MPALTPCSHLLSGLVLLLAMLGPAAARESHLSFEADRAAQQTAARHARELVTFAQSELKLTLDWSDESVREVEELAAALHADVRRRRAGPDDIAPLVKMIGSYVGEVLRRNHGAEWGWVSANGHRVPGLRTRAAGVLFTPVETARRRVHHGAANNLWRSYQVQAGR